jgi:serine/threonine protein kinase
MAEVYVAKAQGPAGFEKLVAVKRILPNISEDLEFINMFVDEAKIAGQLAHTNVAQIFDLGKIGQSYYIAMEYVPGVDLRALWDRTRGKGGIPLHIAVHIVTRICEGLDYAHRRKDSRGKPLSIIHRDVSPQNILCSYDGDVKIIDFGIARAANRVVKTQTGILKGKFAYMAPEQARGQPMDHRADVFAIGVILHELITGERLFRADSDFSLLEKVRKAEVQTPRAVRPDTPVDLERVVMKALAAKPEDRYPWASSMQADLERFLVTLRKQAGREELATYVRDIFRESYEQELERQHDYLRKGGPWDLASGPPSQEPDTGPVDAGPADQTNLFDSEEVEPSTGEAPAAPGPGDSEPTSLLEASALDSARSDARALVGHAPAPGSEPPLPEEPPDPVETAVEQRGSASRPALEPKSGPAEDPPRRRAADKRAAARGAPDPHDDAIQTGPMPSHPRTEDPDVIAAVVGATLVTDESDDGATDPSRAAPALPAPEGDGAVDRPAEGRPAPRHASTSGRRPSREPEDRPAAAGGEAPPSQERRPARSPEMLSTRAEGRRLSLEDLPVPGGPEESGRAPRPERGKSRRPESPLDEDGPLVPPPTSAPLPRASRGIRTEGDSFESSPTAVAGGSLRRAMAEVPPTGTPGLPPEVLHRQSTETSLHSATTGASHLALRPARPAWQLAVPAAAGGLLAGMALLLGLQATSVLGEGTLVVVTGKAEASVQVDDGPAVTGPHVAIPVRAGSRKVTIKAPDFQPDIQRVEVAPGRPTVVEFRARSVRGGLLIKTTPPGASVHLDGQKRPGTTPLTVDDLEPGSTHELVLRHPETEPAKRMVKAPAGEIYNVEIALEYKVTRVVVEPQPDDAVVALDGAFRGRGKVTIRGARLNQRGVLRVYRPGCDPVEVEVTPRGESEILKAVTLACRPMEGSVSLGSPVGSRLHVDNQDTGVDLPVRGYKLPVGRHLFELVTPRKNLRWAADVVPGDQELIPR